MMKKFKRGYECAIILIPNSYASILWPDYAFDCADEWRRVATTGPLWPLMTANVVYEFGEHYCHLWRALNSRNRCAIDVANIDARHWPRIRRTPIECQ